MVEYQFIHTYLMALMGRFITRAREDERGRTGEEIVLIGVAVLGAAVVAGILWAKLKSGAESVTTPTPVAP